jgi:hypothetical protein
VAGIVGSYQEPPAALAGYAHGIGSSAMYFMGAFLGTGDPIEAVRETELYLCDLSIAMDWAGRFDWSGTGMVGAFWSGSGIAVDMQGLIDVRFNLVWTSRIYTILGGPPGQIYEYVNWGGALGGYRQMLGFLYSQFGVPPGPPCER